MASDEELFLSVTEKDIQRLVELYATNEEFTFFIAYEAADPFRTTSYIHKVKLLDAAFRGALKEKNIKDIKLEDFDSDEVTNVLNQLPNLLKTYVIRTEYEFGNNKRCDEQFCYLVFRIIQSDRVFKSYKTFEIAFRRAQPLKYMYNRLEPKFLSNEFKFEVEEEKSLPKPELYREDISDYSESGFV